MKIKVLEKDGYGDDNPLFYTYVVTPADDDTKLIGFALYFFVYSTWMGKRMHLEDLHIEEKYRRKGLGQRLFRTVAEVRKRKQKQKKNKNHKNVKFKILYNLQKALKSGCSQMTWTCLNWNPAQEFYFKQGGYDYTKKTGEHNFRLERDGLEKLVLQN